MPLGTATLRRYQELSDAPLDAISVYMEEVNTRKRI